MGPNHRRNPPQGFTMERNLLKKEINSALNSENPRAVVPHVDEVGHGTFLAGVAAGYDRSGGDYIGAAPDAQLLVVKLKPAKQYLRDYNLIGDPATSVYQSNDVVLALKYVVETARELGKPVAVVLGIGSNEGAHDGTAFTEEYMEELGGRRGVVMLTSAGNEGNTAHHTSGNLANGQLEDIEIKVEKETGLL